MHFLDLFILLLIHTSFALFDFKDIILFSSSITKLLNIFLLLVLQLLLRLELLLLTLITFLSLVPSILEKVNTLCTAELVNELLLLLFVLVLPFILNLLL